MRPFDNSQYLAKLTQVTGLLLLLLKPVLSILSLATLNGMEVGKKERFVFFCILYCLGQNLYPDLLYLYMCVSDTALLTAEITGSSEAVHPVFSLCLYKSAPSFAVIQMFGGNSRTNQQDCTAGATGRISTISCPRQRQI